MNKALTDAIKRDKTYLTMHGIPRREADKIIDDFVTAAAADTSELRMERILTAIAFAMRTEFGFGRQRIQKGLVAFGDIFHAIGTDDLSWKDVAMALRRETGLYVKSDGERWYLDVSEEDLIEGDYE